MKSCFYWFFILIPFPIYAGDNEELLSFQENLPLLICYSSDYRACYNDVTVETCTLDIKVNREQCRVSDPGVSISESLREYTKCLVLSHAGASSVQEINNACITEKGMNINFTENFEKLQLADPFWVQEILK